MDERIIREQIKQLLTKSQAHMDLVDAVKNFSLDAMNIVFPNGSYTPWHLLEHIRRTQYDILNFMTNPQYVDLEWPKDYWPDPREKATQKDWDTTLKKYVNDLYKAVKLLMNEEVKLTEKIPHGQGQTYLREFLLIADHTAYHVGEFAIMRQVMNNWKK